MTQILGVSVWYVGYEYRLPAPNRHHDVIRYIANMMMALDPTWKGPIVGQQGFYDSDGRYLSRKDALTLALCNGQFKSPMVTAGECFSEDLW